MFILTGHRLRGLPCVPLFPPRGYACGRGCPDQCSNQCKAERAARASAIAARSAAAFRQAMVGQRYLVLFEQPEGAYFVGHAPNYVQVAVQAPMHNNEVREVRITAVTEQGCLGELADQSSL